MSTENKFADPVAVIPLSGELTISNVAELAALLKQSLHDNQNIRLNIQEVASMDLACLQVLCSSHRTAAAMGKTLAFQPPVPAELEQLIRLVGFKRQRGCSFSPGTSCLCCRGEE